MPRRMPRRADLKAFIRAHAGVAAPVLCPEVRLHLGADMTALWHDAERALSLTGLAPPYWAFPWVGGQALARYLLDRPESVRGKRVLDFASGSGLAAIAAAKAGAGHVDANDVDPFSLAAIELNLALNRAHAGRLSVVAGDLIGAANAGWDVVLAGDVYYERGLARRAVAWLRGLASGGTEVLLGDQGRAFFPRIRIEERARYSVAGTMAMEGRPSREGRVVRLLA